MTLLPETVVTGALGWSGIYAASIESSAESKLVPYAFLDRTLNL